MRNGFLNNYQNNKKNNKYDINEYYAFQTSRKLHQHFKVSTSLYLYYIYTLYT